MLLKVFVVCLSVSTVLCRPQLLTFKDGNVGVNFGGYHAEAGLGGLLTGDAQHGGLHASAGTPFGQQAGAGLGGTVDGAGRTAGGGYAGASAGGGVGASAAFGGGLYSQTGGGGGVGAEAHIPGKSTKVVKLAQVPDAHTATIVKGDTTTNVQTSTVTKTNIGTRAQVFDDHDDDSHYQQEIYETIPVVTYRKRHHLRPRHHRPRKVYVQKQFIIPQTQIVQTQTTLPTSNVDYRNFVDFGFFSNVASSYGGPHYNAEPVQPKTFTLPRFSTVFNSGVNTNPITYTNSQASTIGNVNAAPNQNFVFHKQINWPGVSTVHSTIGNTYQNPGTNTNLNTQSNEHTNSQNQQFVIQKEINWPQLSISTGSSTYTNPNTYQNPNTNINPIEHENSEVLNKPIEATHQSNVNVQAGAAVNTRSTGFFDDVFNIPISALTSVNQLLNNKSQNVGATVGIEKSVYASV